MDIFTVVKAFGIILAAIYGAIRSRNLFYNVKARLRDETRFAKEFLEMDHETMHPYVREKGYQAIAGSKLISAEEVDHILTLKNADQCLTMYVHGKRYLNYELEKGSGNFSYKGKIPIWFRKWMYFTLYLVFAFIALFPFIFSKILGLDTQNII